MEPQILTAPDLTYAASFSLLNTELLALLNLQANTLDIHRIPEGSSCVSKRVGQLSLPFSQPVIPFCSAAFQQAQACPPSYSSRPRCLPFYLSPDACLVGLTVIAAAKDGTMTFYWFGIRPDYLSSIPETKRDSSSSDRPTPWEMWSPRTAGCFEIEHSLAAPIPAGARWLMGSQSLVVREFGLSRSKKIGTDQKTRNDGVADDALRRETPQDVFALQPQLPYCDVNARMGEKYQSVIADYEWVVGMSGGVRTAPLCTVVKPYSYATERRLFKDDRSHRYPSRRIDPCLTSLRLFSVMGNVFRGFESFLSALTLTRLFAPSLRPEVGSPASKPTE